MACPNTQVMVKQPGSGEEAPKCDNFVFDPDEGLGMRIRLESGLVTRACNNCAFKDAEKRLPKQQEELDGYKERFPDVDYSSHQKGLETAAERLSLWRQVHNSDALRARYGEQVEDGPSQARDIIHRIFFQIREDTIEKITEMASETLEKTGDHTDGNQEWQEKRDRFRNQILVIIAEAKKAVEGARRRGLKYPQRVRILNDGVDNSLIALSEAKDYEEGETTSKRSRADLKKEAEALTGDQADDGSDADDLFTESELKRMTKAELLEIAGQYDLEIKDGTKNTDIAEAIWEKQEERVKELAAAKS